MITNYLSPHVPTSLLLHEILRRRKQLSHVDEQLYKRLYRGFIGETKLNDFTSNLNFAKALPLYGLLLEANEADFQVDCLVITTETIFLLEVKNYTGNYFIKDEKVYSMQTNTEISSPFLQLERSTFLFNKLLEQLNFDLTVRSYIVFVNDAFTLYNAPTHLPIIFPTQIKHFFQKIDANSALLTDRAQSLAKLLISQHKEMSIYDRRPEYGYSELKRGVFCTICTKQLNRKNRLYFECLNCKAHFYIDDVIIHAIGQFNFLFPDKRIMTHKIVDWCGDVISKNTIRQVLKDNLKTVANGPYTHYLFHHSDDSRKLLVESFNYLDK